MIPMKGGNSRGTRPFWGDSFGAQITNTSASDCLTKSRGPFFGHGDGSWDDDKVTTHVHADDKRQHSSQNREILLRY